MGITVKDLGPEYSFGSVVHGVTWDTLKDEAVRQQLRDLFEDRGLIVFEGVEASGKMQAEISQVFGPLKEHPTTTPRATEDYVPGLIDMHSHPRDITNGDLRGLVTKNGTILTRYSPWHFDHCYNDELNLAGVLRVVKNSPEGGRTGFADGVEIYNRFDPELRDKVEGKKALYTLDTRLTTMRFGRDFETHGDMPGPFHSTLEEAKTFPRALHPITFERDNGDKVVHISPWMAVGMENHEDAEGEAIFEAACQELVKHADVIAYWHNWKPNDMVIWDNRRMVHAVEGNDPIYERQSQRTTIRGDYGLGSFEGGKRPGEVKRELAEAMM